MFTNLKKISFKILVNLYLLKNYAIRNLKKSENTEWISLFVKSSNQNQLSNSWPKKLPLRS
ncbi:hypothetical protein OLS41_04815, partial [Campylobacter jejuni]|nr:hypothetical protein [Campylobacter jejuni]